MCLGVVVVFLCGCCFENEVKYQCAVNSYSCVTEAAAARVTSADTVEAAWAEWAEECAAGVAWAAAAEAWVEADASEAGKYTQAGGMGMGSAKYGRF